MTTSTTTTATVDTVSCDDQCMLSNKATLLHLSGLR